MSYSTIFSQITSFDKNRPSMVKDGVDQASFDAFRMAQLTLARSTRALMEGLDLRVSTNFNIFINLARTLFTDKEIATITDRHLPEEHRTMDQQARRYFYTLMSFEDDKKMAVIKQQILDAAEARIAELSDVPDLLGAATRKLRETANGAVDVNVHQRHIRI